jgi:hypothetical protein
MTGQKQIAQLSIGQPTIIGELNEPNLLGQRKDEMYLSVSFASGIYCSKSLTKTRSWKTQAFADEIKSRIRKVSKPIQIFGSVVKRRRAIFESGSDAMAT